MTASREAIYAALFALVAGSAAFKTKSRRLKLWSDVNASDKPALFVAQRGQTYAQGSEATPQAVTLKADVFVYTNAGKDPKVIPATQLNDLVDAVDAALAGSVVTGRQTLGGLVAHCWIEGEVMIDPGDIDGDGVAVIPVRILVP
jgi:hypothetical protein